MIRHVFKALQNNGTLLLRRHKSTTPQIDPDVLKKLDEGFEKLTKSDSKSLLKKHLTLEIFKALRLKKTKTFTLLDCIQSGLINHDSGCGVYAPDPEAYKIFADLFNPVIEDYHFGFKKSDKHPQKNFGNPCDFQNVDPYNNYIASTRIRCARSIAGFPFNPCMTKQHYDNIEDMLHCTLSRLKDDLKGNYYPLLGMKKSIQQNLIDEHFLFKEGDRFLQAAKASRFWPTGRGIYHNHEKTFVVWCNEEDHIRIISMQRGGHFGEVFSRLLSGINAIEEKIPFVHDDRLGYLTFCPTNLGTTVRASVHIRLPKLGSEKKELEEIANKYKLQVRGTRGEHSDAEGGIYDISNKRRLGLTEYDAVKELYCGITEIIKLEKSLKGKATDKKEGKKADIKKGDVKKPDVKAVDVKTVKSTTPPSAEKSKIARKCDPKHFKKADPKSVTKPDPKSAKKPDPKSALKPDPKSAEKPDPKSAKKPDPMPAKKPDPKSAKKPAPMPAKKPDPKLAKKPDPTPAKKPDPKSAKKPDPTPAKKPDPKLAKKPDPTPAKKPDPKSAKKPDPKSAKKPDPTPAKKPDPKSAKKPDPKKSTKKPDPKSAKKSDVRKVKCTKITQKESKQQAKKATEKPDPKASTKTKKDTQANKKGDSKADKNPKKPDKKK